LPSREIHNLPFQFGDSPVARVTVMEQETVELWHRLCVRAMNEPDLKCLMYVLQELNVVLIREEKAIKEEMKQDSHSLEHCRKTATKADREYKK
jgi:hypothetical protein